MPSLTPLLKTHRWCVVAEPTLGQQQFFDCSVGPMLSQCQHANNILFPTTPTITKCGAIDCLLSGVGLIIIYNTYTYIPDCKNQKENMDRWNESHAAVSVVSAEIV